MNKIAVLFPGQSAQYVGMGKSWYERYDIVRQHFVEASEVLGFDLADLCFNGPAKKLNQTEYTQVSILTLSVAMYKAIQKEWELSPAYLAGHSIGELSALTASGVFKFKDAVKLARIRGEAMAACDTGDGAGMMAVINIDSSAVEQLLQDWDETDEQKVQVANYNSPAQTILAGSLKGLNAIKDKLEALGAKAITLNVSGPFHSQYMKGAADALSDALAALQLGSMSVPVMCGHEGRLYTSEDNIKQSLVTQLISPVLWTKVLFFLQGEGAQQWIEVGPKDVLKKLTLQTIANAEGEVFACDLEEDQEELLPRFHPARSIQKESPNFIGLCLGAAVATRNRNWDQQAYQQGVVEPYKKIQALYERVEQEQRSPQLSEMNEVLAHLERIFETKGVPLAERRQRFQKIFKMTGTEALLADYLVVKGEVS